MKSVWVHFRFPRKWPPIMFYRGLRIQNHRAAAMFAIRYSQGQVYIFWSISFPCTSHLHLIKHIRCSMSNELVYGNGNVNNVFQHLYFGFHTPPWVISLIKSLTVWWVPVYIRINHYQLNSAHYGTKRIKGPVMADIRVSLFHLRSPFWNLSLITVSLSLLILNGLCRNIFSLKASLFHLKQIKCPIIL